MPAKAAMQPSPDDKVGKCWRCVILHLWAPRHLRIQFLGLGDKLLNPALTVATPFGNTPTGLLIFAAASILKDGANRFGDLLDDGKPNKSFGS